MPARLLVPPVTRPAIVRPELVERLSARPAPFVTMITAPAGWGKTTLAAQLAGSASAAGRGVTWLSLEERDTLQIVAADLIRGLRLAHPILDLDLRELEVPPVADDLPAVFDRIAAALDSLVDDVLLVLDDAHLLADDAALGAIARLVNQRHPRLHLVLTGRTEPALPVHRWRMNGLLDDVGVADLAVDAAQVGALLAGLGLRLAAADVARLIGVTEGWIGGIRLAARTIGAAADSQAALDRLVLTRGVRGGLADYLIEQVVAELPAGTRAFLREVSIVNPVPVGLAERLTGRTDARALLREVSTSTGFVSADDPTEQRYRLHHSLAAALQYQLDGAAGDRREALHREASRWFAEQDRTLSAAQHALLGQAWSDAGALLLAGLPRLLLRGAVPQIRRLLSGIPRAVILRDPMLAVVDLGTRAWSGEFADHEQLAAAVESGLGELATARPALADSARFVLVMTRAGFARIAGRYAEVLDLLADRRTTGLAGPGDTGGGSRWQALAQSNYGTAALWCGHPGQAHRALTAATRSADHLGFSLPALNSESLLSWIELREGRLAAAATRARAAVDAAERRGWATVYQAAAAHLTLAAVALERADLDAADASLARARRANEGWQEVAVALITECLGARVQTARSRPDEALAVLRQVRSDLVSRPAIRELDEVLIEAEAAAWCAAGDPDRALAGLRGRADLDPGLIAVTRARQLLAAGEPVRAVQILAADHGAGRPERRRGTRIRAHLWLARARQLTGDSGGAAGSVRNALDLAGGDGYRLPFLELGAALRPLLDPLRGGPSPGQRAVIADLTTSLGPAAAPGTRANGPGLTAREGELLTLLATLMTHEEIAGRLGISVNTVKSHARAVYRKLEVANRRAAVRRAEETGLL